MPISVDIGQEAGHTLDRSLVNHRAETGNHSQSHSQLWKFTEAVDFSLVFGLWDEAGVLRENSKSTGNNMQTPCVSQQIHKHNYVINLVNEFISELTRFILQICSFVVT